MSGLRRPFLEKGVGQSLVVNSRVQPGVEDVHEQAHEHVDKGREQHERLHERVVSVGDGIDQKKPEAVEVEDLLGDNQSTHEEGELETELLKMGGLQGELINMLLYRKLFKRAYYLKPIDLDDEKRKVIMKLDDHDKRTQKENELAVRAGIPEGHVIIDAPVKELKFSEPRLYQTDIKILDKNVKPLSRYTPLANALKLRNIPEWAMMVLTDKKYIEPLNKVVEKVLFG